jgi:hypothetical protein
VHFRLRQTIRRTQGVNKSWVDRHPWLSLTTSRPSSGGRITAQDLRQTLPKGPSHDSIHKHAKEETERTGPRRESVLWSVGWLFIGVRLFARILPAKAPDFNRVFTLADKAFSSQREQSGDSPNGVTANPRLDTLPAIADVLRFDIGAVCVVKRKRG